MTLSFSEPVLLNFYLFWLNISQFFLPHLLTRPQVFYRSCLEIRAFKLICLDSRLNLNKSINPEIEVPITIPHQIPTPPNLNLNPSKYELGNAMHQNPTKLITIGIFVSFSPLKGEHLKVRAESKKILFS